MRLVFQKKKKKAENRCNTIRDKGKEKKTSRRHGQLGEEETVHCHS